MYCLLKVREKEEEEEEEEEERERNRGGERSSQMHRPVELTGSLLLLAASCCEPLSRAHL
jgi:hypothetical protein